MNRHDRSNIKKEADISRDEKETFNDKIMVTYTKYATIIL